MGESHPLNPYGNNYIDHPYETKLFYKFNSVKKYVHLSPEDEERVQKANVYFAAGILGTLIGSAGLCLLLNRFVLHRYINLYEHASNYQNYYIAFISGCSTTLAYSYLTTLHVEQICRPLLFKYLEEAKKQGFDDYEISYKVE